MPLDELRAAVLALPVDEKLKLVEELWDSIEVEDTSPFTPAQLAELERREAYLLKYPESVRPWAEVYERLKARYGG